jgi:CubicO group peptidase (beta-lactamase class C family)
MIDCFFYRKSNAFVQPNLFDSRKGNNFDYDKLYVSSDPNIKDDGFVTQSNINIFKKSVGYSGGDKYAGGFAESGVGTLSDFAKLLKMIINKGIYYKNINGQKQIIRILQEQSIEYLLNPKADFKNNGGIWSCGSGTINFIQPHEIWAGGFAVTNRYKGEKLPIGIGSNVYRWMGYYGHHYYFDTITGNYIIGGIESSNASWTPNNISFEPDSE